MIALLKLLIFGHLHKWVTIREARYEEWETMGAGKPSKVATKYVCRCDKCGSIKAFIA